MLHYQWLADSERVGHTLFHTIKYVNTTHIIWFSWSRYSFAFIFGFMIFKKKNLTLRRLYICIETTIIICTHITIIIIQFKEWVKKKKNLEEYCRIKVVTKCLSLRDLMRECMSPTKWHSNFAFSIFLPLSLSFYFCFFYCYPKVHIILFYCYLINISLIA